MKGCQAGPGQDPDRIWRILALAQPSPVGKRADHSLYPLRPPMKFTASQKRALAWLGIAGVLALLLWLLAPVLTPFVVAAVLAYALTPLVNKLDALGGGKL